MWDTTPSPWNRQYGNELSQLCHEAAGRYAQLPEKSSQVRLMVITVQSMIMLFGAMVAAAGVLLLFLRNDQGQNKIKILSQEFEISTPALVVFLCGCCIFVLPLLRPGEELTRPALILGSVGAAQADSFMGSRRIEPGGEEKEPNDQVVDANALHFGTRVRGVIASGDDRDYFRFRTPEKPPEKVVVIVRKLRRGGFAARVSLYDQTERNITWDSQGGDNQVSLSFPAISNSDYYVLVKGVGSDRGPYELEIR
jgi:hypothetical protein